LLEAMIRRDYILKMIEEFIQVLARLNSLKRSQKWQEVDSTLEEGFQRLIGVGAGVVSRFSETELLAKIMRGEPTQVVQQKMWFLTTLLSQAGEIALAQDRLEQGRACYLKGLNVLLYALAQADSMEFPEFVPKVDAFVIALEDSPLPMSTLLGLMRHYEQAGAFGKAEDALFSMVEAMPAEPKVLDFGVAFYHRLGAQSDASLTAGNLPRGELDASLKELERRRAALR
jgi:hypothetical protein